MHANRKSLISTVKILTLLGLVALAIIGCTPKPPSSPVQLSTHAPASSPVLSPQYTPMSNLRLIEFGDGKHAILANPVRYEIGKSGIEILVPKGFVTDHASIPQFLWSFGLTRHGLYGRAAVVHDFLYWSKVCTREQADNILEIAMKEHEVGAVKRFIISTGLSIFGSAGWEENNIDLKNKFPRVIPEEYWEFDQKLTWPEYRLQLLNKGIKDPVWPSSPKYCTLGDTTNVPTAKSN